MNIVLIILLLLVAIVISGGIGYTVAKTKINHTLTVSQQTATDITNQAATDAEQLKKKALVEARDESQRYQQRIESELQERLSEVKSQEDRDRKSTRLNSSHVSISYAVFCLKKKRKIRKKTNYRKSQRNQ